jgi:uncharacterized protein (UPF0335 family)
MNTVNITVPQAVEVPLEPIVEAVRQALYSVSAPIDDVMENITSGGSLAKAVESIVDDYDFASTLETVLEQKFDITDYDSDITGICEQWHDYNFDITNYSEYIEEVVQSEVQSELENRGLNNLDPCDFPSFEQVHALKERVQRLENQMGTLIEALRVALTAVENETSEVSE